MVHGNATSLLTTDDGTNATTSMTRKDDTESQIESLQKQISQLTTQLHSLQGVKSSQSSFPPAAQGTKKKNRLMPHATTVYYEQSQNPDRRQVIGQQRARLGRNASIGTRNVLNALPHQSTTAPETTSIAQRVISMFRDPTSHMDYLNSAEFAQDLLKLCSKVRKILEREPRCLYCQSPAYVFGDIHGNLEDLHFFSDNVWRLGMSLTAGNFVFLGDYVDRGMSCLECVAYLFAIKLLNPQKVFLLRGNHETRDVNGWEEHYGERSFMYQCRSRFGDHLGYKLWEQTNQVFDRMPLSAVIDQDIFCVHGGIPRPISRNTNIQDILKVPRVAGINPPYGHEEAPYQQVASDCIWSDPATEHQEATGVDPSSGFGESLRGGGAICFGHKAVTNFLQKEGMSYIMRAHEAHAEGVAVSKGARVFTVFSTSKDHNQGSQAMAGCILVDFDKLQVINRSPAYKNQYVHRRDSVSLAALTESEIQQRVRLGLVTTTVQSDSDEEEQQEEEEEWDNISDDDEDEDGKESSFTFDLERRSSVNASSTCSSPLGSSHDNHDVSLHRAEGTDHLSMEFGDSSSSFGRRSSRCASINEGDEQDEIETVGSEDEAMAW